jgi:hypothetical protein
MIQMARYRFVRGVAQPCHHHHLRPEIKKHVSIELETPVRSTPFDKMAMRYLIQEWHAVRAS